MKMFTIDGDTDIFEYKNIYDAWLRFKSGKSKRADVCDFELNLITNLKILESELKSESYTHGDYQEFTIVETKKRVINKASVRDRIVHHLVYNTLYTYFDKLFIYDSYSCRINKGTHKAVLRYERYARKISKNYTKQAYVLKLDIKKCFASIDHNKLKSVLSKYIKDNNILDLLVKIIDSYKSDGALSVGIPLGNLTSQLFVNVYLHELDFYCKQRLRLNYYIRYADDIVIFLENENKCKAMLCRISLFCKDILGLEIHKVETKTTYSGMDFLGWIHFAKYRVLRKSTKVKMLNNVDENNIASYQGLLKWGNTFKLYVIIIIICHQ